LENKHGLLEYQGKQSVAPIMACAFPQFLSLGKGLWWLFIILGMVMVFFYRMPWLYGRRGLKTAIISVQIANLIGGIAFYYLPGYRPVIALAVGVFCLIFPLRRMLIIGFEISAEKKKSIELD